MSGLTALFVGAHIQLAAATDTPELAITEDEGAEFLKRAQNVLRHYSVETTQKTLDWISFYGVIGMMYGTRGVAIYNRRRGEREPRQRPDQGEVIRGRFRPLPPDQGGGAAVAGGGPVVDRTGSPVPDLAAGLDIRAHDDAMTEELAT